MIQESYVSFEIAKLLKEKGFDVSCLSTYDINNGKQYFHTSYIMCATRINAPTHQMACSWLREVHKIGIFPGIYIFTDVAGTQEYHHYGTAIIDLTTYKLMYDDVLAKDTYEEAVEAALKYVLENLI